MPQRDASGKFVKTADASVKTAGKARGRKTPARKTGKRAIKTADRAGGFGAGFGGPASGFKSAG